MYLYTPPTECHRSQHTATSNVYCSVEVVVCTVEENYDAAHLHNSCLLIAGRTCTLQTATSHLDVSYLGGEVAPFLTDGEGPLSWGYSFIARTSIHNEAGQSQLTFDTMNWPENDVATPTHIGGEVCTLHLRPLTCIAERLLRWVTWCNVRDIDTSNGGRQRWT
jgi:hypothetical protein